MQGIFISFCTVLLLFISTIQKSHALLIEKDSSQVIKEACIDILKNTKASHCGKTEKGNPYTVFAIKRGKEWTFVVLDSTGYFSFRQKKKREEISENSQASTEMLCVMFQRKTLKVKNKPKNVSGLTLSNYYRFRPSAKKIYRSTVKIQRKTKFVNNTLKQPGGAGKLLKRSLQ